MLTNLGSQPFTGTFLFLKSNYYLHYIQKIYKIVYCNISGKCKYV